jgi:hypothetical protein
LVASNNERGIIMKLSQKLKQDDTCGDFGDALNGYSDEAKEIEDLLQMCIKDLYSQSGNFKKKTALSIVKYVSKNGIEV